MGYGFMAYAIDLDALKAIVGSGKQPALDEALADFGNEAAGIDALLESHSDETNPLPTARDALRQLIMGERLDDRIGFAYAYCLKHLCQVHGEFLDNSTWYPAPPPFLDEVQTALEGAGVPRQTFSVDRLSDGGSPIPIPPVDDFPGIGFVARPAVREAFDALSRVKLDDIADDDVRESIVGLTGWLATCRDRNCDLVCFYH